MAEPLSDADKKEINRDLLDAIVYGKDSTKKDEGKP